LFPGLRDIGLLQTDEDVCNVDPHEDLRMTASTNKYQTLTGNAVRLVWKDWTIPNPPPTGAVAISEKPVKFIASNANFTAVGYMDPSAGLGKVIFPQDAQSYTEGLILAEIEPERYEVYEVQFKKDKDFKETDIVLTEGLLKYAAEERKDEYDLEAEYENEPPAAGPNKGRIESVLSYITDEFDYWGAGHLMAKNLHTFIHLPNGWKPNAKTIEWGLPFARGGKYLY